MSSRFMNMIDTNIKVIVGFSFAIILTIANIIFLYCLVTMSDTKGDVISLFIIFFETILYLWWRYYRHPKLT